MNETSEQPASGPGMSEDEAKKYVEELRGTPADQIVTDLLLSAINSAQVKLGREDARVFIDLSATMLDTVRGRIPDEIAKQIDQAVSQLRIAQVQAETDAKESRDGGDGGQATASGASAQASPTGAEPGAEQASKLWVPGRD